MYFILTDAGIAAQQANGSTPLTFTSFRLGSNFGYVPVTSQDDILGTLLHSGTPSSPIIEASSVVKYSIVLDSSVGNFSFGEVALVLGDGSVGAIGVNSTLISKYQTSTTLQFGTHLVIDCYISNSGFIYAQLSNSDNPISIPRVPNISSIPQASSTDYNAYVVTGPTVDNPSIIAVSNSLLWTVMSYESKYATLELASVSGSDPTSLTFTNATTLADLSYEGQLLLQGTSGANMGVLRTITYANPSVFNYKIDFSLLNPPQAGDQFVVLRHTMLEDGVYKLLSSLNPTIDPARINDFTQASLADFLRLDGSSLPTANISMNGKRLTNLGAPVAGSSDAVPISLLESTVTAINSSISQAVNNGLLQSGWGAPTGSTPINPPMYLDTAYVPSTLYSYAEGTWKAVGARTLSTISGAPTLSTLPDTLIKVDITGGRATLYIWDADAWKAVTLGSGVNADPGVGALVDSNVAVSGSATFGLLSTDHVTFNGAIANIPNGLNFLSGSVSVNAGIHNAWGTTRSFTVGSGAGESGAFEFSKNASIVGGLKYSDTNSLISLGSVTSLSTELLSANTRVGLIDTSGRFSFGSSVTSTSNSSRISVKGIGSSTLSGASPETKPYIDLVSTAALPAAGTTLGGIRVGNLVSSAFVYKGGLQFSTPTLWSGTNTQIDFQLNLVKPNTATVYSAIEIKASSIDNNKHVLYLNPEEAVISGTTLDPAHYAGFRFSGSNSLVSTTFSKFSGTTAIGNYILSEVQSTKTYSGNDTGANITDCTIIGTHLANRYGGFSQSTIIGRSILSPTVQYDSPTSVDISSGFTAVGYNNMPLGYHNTGTGGYPIVDVNERFPLSRVVLLGSNLITPEGTTPPSSDKRPQDIIAIGSNSFTRNNKINGSIAIGNKILSASSAASSITEDNVTFSVLLGHSIAYGSPDTAIIDTCTIIGNSAARNLTGPTSNSTIIGNYSLYDATDVTNSVSLGDFSGRNAASASLSVFAGYFAGNVRAGATSSKSVAIGAYSGAGADFLNSSVFIGSSSTPAPLTGITPTAVVSIGYNTLSTTNSTATPTNTIVIGNNPHHVTHKIGNNCVIIGSGEFSGVWYDVGNPQDSVGANTTSPELHGWTVLGSTATAFVMIEGTALQSSDIKYKDNVESLTPSYIEIAYGLRPVSFQWNEKKPGRQGKKDIGFIANEVEGLIKNLGLSNSEVPLVYGASIDDRTINYQGLFPILVAAIQDLNARIKVLEAQ